MRKLILVLALIIFTRVPSFSQVIVYATTTVTSPPTVITAIGTGSVITGIGKYNSINITATTQGATGGVLDIYLQTSFDGGTTWYDYAHYPQLSAGAAAATRTWTVSKGAQQTTLTTIGSGTTPALAANTIVGGAWGDQLRILFVAGASTSAGASQVINYFFTQ